MTKPDYLMESAGEGVRLEKKTDAAAVRRRLELLDIPVGGRALDAGAGTGAIARLIAEKVGRTGSVVAFDASAERLELGENIAKAAGVTNVEFVRGNLYSLPFPKESFDFVWSEFVFEYLADPDRVLASLASLVRPGGKLVIVDLDGNGVFHEPMPPALEGKMQRLLRGLEGSFDAHAGRKLFGRFHRAGLSPAKVHVMPYHLYPGAIDEHERTNWERKMDGLRVRGELALGGKTAYDEFVQEYLAVFDDPATFSYSILVMVEWTRPQ